jgi:hypothetical protein
MPKKNACFYFLAKSLKKKEKKRAGMFKPSQLMLENWDKLGL